ncbi:MAG: DNA-3-methyladenine glycosylase I [Desulfovibrio sp.]
MCKRCFWVPEGKDYYVRYHDEEWGVPLYDDDALFELLILESAQAGLSWETILRKREGYRAAFAGFDARTIAGFGPADEERLMADAGIVRNRAKIKAAMGNARVFLEIQAARGSFSDYLWDFVDGEPLRNAWKGREEVPASTPVSDALAKDLKKRGMRFVGSTTMYAFMQSAGLVNDHTVDCFRWAELNG